MRKRRPTRERWAQNKANELYVKGVAILGTVAASAGIAACAVSNARAMNTEPACAISHSYEEYGDVNEAADRCAADRVGKVALVSFGFNQSQMDIVASDSSSVLAGSTDGLIKPEMVPLIASDEARNKLLAINDRCTYGGSSELSAAAVADDIMSLEGYDHVVGLTTLKLCDDTGAPAGYGGLAIVGAGGGRLANISTQTIKRKNWENWAEGDTVSDFVAHEVSHLYGLGHSNTLNPSANFGDVGLFKGERLPILNSRRDTIDLDAMLKTPEASQRFKEYEGGSNVMGIHADGMNPLAIQRWQLTWPERVDGATDRQKIINDAEVSIDFTQDKDHDFAVLKLDEPVVFKVRTRLNVDAEFSYDKLVFDLGEEHSRYVHVYLADTPDAETVSFGTMSFIRDKAVENTIIIGKQIIKVRATPNEGVVYTDMTGREDPNEYRVAKSIK